MSDQPDPRRTRLLAETFSATDWATGPAAAFAHRAAAHARLRRATRRALVASTALTTAALALFFTLRPPVSTSPSPTLAFSPISSPAPLAAALSSVALPARTAPAYEILTDEELFAALDDRPVLILPQERPDRRIVVLK